jgi:cyclophilin family peptidyl-prolyl cis-trans isomerase
MAVNLMTKTSSWIVIGKGKWQKSIDQIIQTHKLTSPPMILSHTRLLVMANKGPNTNQSQWFVTLAPADHLTGKHVVFGRVQSGFDVVQEIGRLETDNKHRPLGGAEVVQIVHCGQLERKQKPRTDKSADESLKSCATIHSCFFHLGV